MKSDTETGHKISNTEEHHEEQDTGGNAPQKYKSKILDDGIQTLTVDNYISYRLEPMLAKFLLESPALSFRLRFFQICMIVTTGAIAATISFRENFWAPVMVAWSTALSQYMSQQGFEVRLTGKNNAIMKLKSLLFWWKGLTRTEQTLRVNKQHLVATTEAIIISTVGSYIAHTRSSRNKAADQEEDEEEDKENANNV
jgi:hypothetical protein